MPKSLNGCSRINVGEKCFTPHLTDNGIKTAFVKAANKVLVNKDTIAQATRIIMDTAFDTTALKQERMELADD